MSKPNEMEELSVDFFDEVEDIIDEDLTLEETEETEDVPEETTQEETSEKSEETEESEETQEEATDEDVSVVESIRSRLGYEIEGEFDDTEEGIQLLVEKAIELGSQGAIDLFFNEYPDVKEHLEYRRLGGNPDDFFKTRFPEVDYSKVELKEDDESQHEQLIRQELRLVRGMSADEIEAEIEDYKNGGILESKAKRSLSALKAKQESDNKNLIEEKRKEAKQRETELVEHWTNIKETINKATSIKNVTIPTKDKDAFFDFISRPVDQGRSAAMIAHDEADLETRLLFDYMLFKKLNFADLITNKAKDVNAKTLRSRMKSAKLDKRREETSSHPILEELGTI